MNDTKDQKEFWIILWSTEDIKVEGVDLKVSINSDLEAKDVDTKVETVDLKKIKEMGLSGLKDFLDTNSDKALIVCSPKEKLEDVDFWKLGFVMGKLCKNKKTPIISFLKGDIDSFFNQIRECCYTSCDSEIAVKTKMKLLMQDFGIYAKYSVEEFTKGKKLLKSGGRADVF